jgi:hypothetical protein
MIKQDNQFDSIVRLAVKRPKGKMSKGKNVENKNIENQNKKVRCMYKLEDQTEEDLYFNIISLSAFLSINICIIFIFDVFPLRPFYGTPFY